VVQAEIDDSLVGEAEPVLEFLVRDRANVRIAIPGVTVEVGQDPDPTVPEVIRNHPIRQPVLWMQEGGMS